MRVAPQSAPALQTNSRLQMLHNKSATLLRAPTQNHPHVTKQAACITAAFVLVCARPVRMRPAEPHNPKLKCSHTVTAWAVCAESG
jgi:hypothetical protein